MIATQSNRYARRLLWHNLPLNRFTKIFLTSRSQCGKSELCAVCGTANCDASVLFSLGTGVDTAGSGAKAWRILCECAWCCALLIATFSRKRLVHLVSGTFGCSSANTFKSSLASRKFPSSVLLSVMVLRTMLFDVNIYMPTKPKYSSEHVASDPGGSVHAVPSYTPTTSPANARIYLSIYRQGWIEPSTCTCQLANKLL
jgi:hypothetical protein